jgi:hypothetical protein
VRDLNGCLVEIASPIEGKVRRRIKLRSLGDFVAKDCQAFLVPALIAPV